MSEFTVQVTDLNERVFLEQALSFFREMRRTCGDAPDGEALARTEIVARDQGRDVVRRAFEAVLNEQARPVEKKGRRSEAAPAAEPTGGTAVDARSAT
jgi:hypothetical protein